MGKFRKKPVVIEAIQLPDYAKGTSPTTFYEFKSWAERHGCEYTIRGHGQDEVLCIKTLEGEMQALAGDWIIRGVKGEFYPCKPDIFAQTYEAVEDSIP